MERTTIYLDETLKHLLIELSAEESRKRGKRVAMAEMVRDAITMYLQSKGKVIEEQDVIKKRMLSTKGKLGEDFKRRVKEVQREANSMFCLLRVLQ